MADGKVVYDITGDNSQFEKDTEQTKSIAAQAFGGIKEIGKAAFVAIGASVAAVGAGIGAAVKGASDFAQVGDNIDKMSQKLGMSAERYQEWDAILQHSGANIDSLTSGMKTLATAAETGNKAFEKLGLSQDEIANMSQEELFSATIEALQNVDDETERTYLAGQLLGRGATELGALLNTSAEDTEAMRQRVHELGGVLSDEAVKSAAQFKDNLQDMKTALGGVKNSVVSEFLPSLSQIMSGFTSLIAGEQGATEEMQAGIASFLESFANSAVKVGEIATEIVPALIEGVIDQLPQIVEMATDLIVTIVNTLVDNLPQIIKTGITLLLTLTNAIIDNIDELIPAVVSCITEIVIELTKPETLIKLIEAAIKLVLAIGEGLIKAIPQLITAAGELISNLLEPFATIGEKFWDIGKDIVQGLIDGVKGWAQNAFNAIDDFGNNLLNGAKRILGIKSPSKEFKLIGRYIDEGLSEGIEDFSKLPLESTDEMLGGLLNGAMITPTLEYTHADPSAEGLEAITRAVQAGNIEDPASGMTAVLEVDGQRFGTLFLPYFNMAKQRVGVDIMEGTSWT